MYQLSDLMIDLRTFGTYPQTSGGSTRWTVIGSECDSILTRATPSFNGKGFTSAIDMRASHAIIYAHNTPNSCYDHGDAIKDESPNQDAAQYYCDTSDPVNSPCGTGYDQGGRWKYKDNGPRGLMELYNVIKS
jgi:hypothetical protein